MEYTERRGFSLQEGAQEHKLFNHEPNILGFQKSFTSDTELKSPWLLVTGQNGLSNKSILKNLLCSYRASSHWRKHLRYEEELVP